MPDNTIPGTPKGCERIAYVVGFQENAAYSDVYGGGGATVGLDCHLIRPALGKTDCIHASRRWRHVPANGTGARASRAPRTLG